MERRAVPLPVIAARTLRGIERNAARVLVGAEPRALDLLQQLRPAGVADLVARLQKRLPFT